MLPTEIIRSLTPEEQEVKACEDGGVGGVVGAESSNLLHILYSTSKSVKNKFWFHWEKILLSQRLPLKVLERKPVVNVF